MIVRINRGTFDATRVDVAKITAILRNSAGALVPAIQALAGQQSYQTGLDTEHGTMFAVSIWDTLAHAHALDTLPEMLAQRPLLEAQGIAFDHISLYESLWRIGA